MTTEIRCKVELREDDTRQSPGRLTGVLLTYGERASDRPELFERGAFDLDAIKASGGIVINRQHTRGAPSPALTGVPASVLKYMAWAVVQGAPGAHGQRRPAHRVGNAGCRGPGGHRLTAAQPSRSATRAVLRRG